MSTIALRQGPGTFTQTAPDQRNMLQHSSLHVQEAAHPAVGPVRSIGGPSSSSTWLSSSAAQFSAPGAGRGSLRHGCPLRLDRGHIAAWHEGLLACHRSASSKFNTRSGRNGIPWESLCDGASGTCSAIQMGTDVHKTLILVLATCNGGELGRVFRTDTGR